MLLNGVLAVGLCLWPLPLHLLLLLQVWHEGRTLGPGKWAMAQIVVDDGLKGTRWVAPPGDCGWVPHRACMYEPP